MAGLFDAEGGLPDGAASSTAVLDRIGEILDAEQLDKELNGFDWVSPGDEYIAVGEQRPIAVYRNSAGGVVIRERGDDAPDDDMFIVCRDVAAVRAVIAALSREIGGGK